jgi:hypothetical protein
MKSEIQCQLRDINAWLRKDGGLTISSSNAARFASKAEAEAATTEYNSRCTEPHAWKYIQVKGEAK